MPVVSTLSNHWKYQLGDKAVDVSADTFKIILMADTFAFNKDTHATLADLTGELATGNGYTQQATTLSGGTWAEDDSGDKAARTFDNVTWTAASGAIGPTGAAIVYDDTSADDTVVGCIDFGEDYTIPDGSAFQIQTIIISLT